jgi:hypothetical protein
MSVSEAGHGAFSLDALNAGYGLPNPCLHGRDDSANENEATPRGGLALVRTALAARLDGLEETRKWDDDGRANDGRRGSRTSCSSSSPVIHSIA